MLRMAYHHIRPSDDLQHVGTFSPDVRDDARHERNLIVNTMLELKGEAGWAAKIKMAAEPMCAFFKDRIIALAEEQWANEIDAEVFSREYKAEFNKTGKALPATNEAMFNVMVDRIEELDEL